jgi:endonuclease YncB( thermonuclease family)
MAHDFNRYPELTNNQMQFYYFQSPHKQIVEDFNAKIEEVVDGDTVKVSVDFRDFDFKVRLANINSKELGKGGEEAKDFLKNKIEGLEVLIKVNPENRVGKYGRIIGDIVAMGQNVSEMMLRNKLADTFGTREYWEII